MTNKATKNAAESKRSKSSTLKGDQVQAMAIADANEIDDDSLSTSFKPPSRSKHAHAVLPLASANKLCNTLKLLVNGWASEENILGNTKSYLNTLSKEVMKKIAVPTTMGELREIDSLGEHVINQYGGRILQAVENFVKVNDLGEYLATPPVAKKIKMLAVEVVDLLSDDEDE